MVRVIGTVWVMPPPVAFTVTVNVPVVADLLALRVIVEVPEPGAAIDVLLNDTVTPLPSPDAESAIAESKLPDTAVVSATDPDVLWVTDNEVGEAVSVKPAATLEVTVSETVAVCVMPPPVPVTVIV
jgi:hypothetical protein